MGNYIGNLYKRLFGATSVRILILGLDASGKTTLLYKLKLGTISTIPTIGFNVETFQYKNVEFTAWDVGGGDKIAPLYRHYYQNVHGIIYMVNSGDRERIGESVDRFKQYILHEDVLRDARMLIFSNKQDLPGAMTPEEISQKFGIDQFHPEQRQRVFLQGVSLTSCVGLNEGLDWLSQQQIQENL